MKPKDFPEFVQGFLAIAVVLTFLGLAAIYFDVYKEALIGALNLALGYWLGSSSGSKQKTDLINEKTSSGS